MSRYGIDWSKGLENFTDEDYDQIISETTKIIENKEPKELLPDAYYDRGVAYRDRGDNEKAISDFTFAINLEFTPRGAAHYNRGKLFAIDREYEKALHDMNETLRIDTDDEDAKRLIPMIKRAQKARDKTQ